MMKLLDVAESLSRAATCARCGEPSPEEFTAAISAALDKNPALLADPDASITLVCGSCSSKGLCSCGKHHRRGA